jgi:hypothetical protein
VVLSIVFTARIRADHASNEGDVGPELTFVKARHGKSRCKRLSQNRCLYSITTNQAAIIALFRVINSYVGNLPPMPGVFPDYPAPVIGDTEAGREMVMMRSGNPPPPLLPCRFPIRVGYATCCLFRERPFFLDSAPPDERA